MLNSGLERTTDIGTRFSDDPERRKERPPRFTLPSAPTGSSWMSLVERFFGVLTSEVIRNGDFTAVKQRKGPIRRECELSRTPVLTPAGKASA